MELLQQLVQLGLTEKEARVYLKALELGTFTVAEVAKKSELKRPGCYLILEDLVQKGFVSIVPNEKKLLYAAENPDALVKHSENQANLARSILSNLHNVYRRDSEKPIIKFFNGINGARRIYEEMTLAKPTDVYYMASVVNMVDQVGEEWMDKWIPRRVAAGIRVHGIRTSEELPERYKKYMYTAKKKMLRNYRHAPDNIFIQDTVFVFNHTVAVISRQKNGFGFIVENADFHDTMKTLWDSLWASSKPEKSSE